MYVLGKAESKSGGSIFRIVEVGEMNLGVFLLWYVDRENQGRGFSRANGGGIEVVVGLYYIRDAHQNF